MFPYFFTTYLSFSDCMFYQKFPFGKGKILIIIKCENSSLQILSYIKMFWDIKKNILYQPNLNTFKIKKASKWRTLVLYHSFIFPGWYLLFLQKSSLNLVLIHVKFYYTFNFCLVDTQWHFNKINSIKKWTLIET